MPDPKRYCEVCESPYKKRQSGAYTCSCPPRQEQIVETVPFRRASKENEKKV